MDGKTGPIKGQTGSFSARMGPIKGRKGLFSARMGPIKGQRALYNLILLPAGLLLLSIANQNILVIT
ncbi:MAG: hypothetical protein A2509_00235 [Candidatus Edwardsbacteria bacterium RIFOXYD12_FULL_50_11]|uniref:Uncharacterized protein n=1 Tax=Candidatus Edwardsbacteria bacterium GWF2_54_11 TaxID=1817851 RepID=A0A1F5RI72_9BACT|nr:MAG: hypothetical protein A2502_00890 [Candidatus Edwardsbacteria bacterium RifOxyC12_full_54_24]OGF06143.1 MAG: hypothetical protein A2273_11290 [Candidatus Edwardsbacteria bacterium RifOxyA12_full_54_48]OGF12590.1 MAG: hypothetical protein A3K15_01980 [Candidatus Edwardsbacteria bacterium GWE2_54_12]OGF13873.1 MAG: hypothetical protein A2024_10530 [Candidatus Edwardsbacteria bacterium GWF2_54_11]OGF17571.1 MAG: hypothetical protein A2509_00235 [Candidatus Edwardsbacteria bacterium RIFOXYD1